MKKSYLNSFYYLLLFINYLNNQKLKKSEKISYPKTTVFGNKNS